MTEPRVSIVVRTKNEAEDIKKTLCLVGRQILKPCQIIVVDSGSTDGTVEIVQGWSGIKLIQIDGERFTYGWALNIGFAAAEGEIVVSLSAHAFPCHEQWLNNLVRHFDDLLVAGVYGRQLPHTDAWPPVKRDLLNSPYGEQLRIQRNPGDPRDHYFSNVSAAIRRKFWLEHAFDETLPYCEDWEWAHAMLRSGYKIVYDPDAAVFHSHNESFLKVYDRSYKEALARRLLYDDSGVGLRGGLKMWLSTLLGDIRFIVRNGGDRRWLFWAPVYRLPGIYAHLRPGLSAALWKVVAQSCKQLCSRATPE